MAKKTIGVDFDGVIHGYSKGWHDGTIYDEPIQGVNIVLSTLQDMGFEILIFSTRCNEKPQRDAMIKYLDKYKIPYDKVYDGVGKPLMTMLIDDNAVRFEQDWVYTLSKVLKYLRESE